MINKVIQDRICHSTDGRMVVVHSIDQIYGRRLYYIMDFANDRWCSVIDREAANLYSSHPRFWDKSDLLPSGVGVDTCPGYSILGDNINLKSSAQRPLTMMDGEVLLLEYRGEVYSVRAINGQVDIAKMRSE
jgi:hypothetical protein